MYSSHIIRYMYELVGKGSTYEELRRNLEGLPSHVMVIIRENISVYFICFIT